MTEHLSIPRAELEALLSKLENSQLDYAERVGRAQGYLDKWLMTANNCKKCGEAHPRQGHWPDRLCTDCYKAVREAAAHCANCGKETPPAMLSTFGLCPGCYYSCRCLDVPGDNKDCPVHAVAPIAGDTCGECWNYKGAKVVKRYRISWWTPQTSADNFDEVTTLSCRCDTGRFAYYEQLPEHLRAATTTRKLGVIG